MANNLGFPNGADSIGAGRQAASAIHRGYVANSDTLSAPAGGAAEAAPRDSEFMGGRGSALGFLIRPSY